MAREHHRPTGPTQRMLRVGELVRHALAQLFARGEIEDDDLAGAVITVPEVRMSPDLKLASAYVMPLGGERAAEIVEALNRHQRFIRGRIAPEIDLKFAPEIRFFVDETFEEFGKIDALLRSDRVQRDLQADEDDGKDFRLVARDKRPVSGWLVLDKPLGMTSTQAVGKVRWLYNAEKAGHAGTLDPLATGLLPIALGEATKTVPFVQAGGKRYRFEVEWGSETATDDAEGEIVATSGHRPAEAELRAALPAFTGTILQRPPAFSAILVNGQRAYDLARAGETVELAERPVTITELTLLRHSSERSSLEMACEKGTYVRALARDLARKLGTRGHVTALRRSAVGGFGESDIVTLDQLEAAPDRDALLRPIASVLGHLPELRMSPDDAAAIRNGGAVLLRGAAAPIELPEAWASIAGTAIAIGVVRAGQFHPSRVLKG